MSDAQDSMQCALEYAKSLSMPKGKVERLVPHYVYMIAAPCGDLLYVGMASNVERRLKEHKEQSQFWRDDCKVFSFEARTRRAALDYERAAIKTLKPKYNKMHSERVEVKE